MLVHFAAIYAWECQDVHVSHQVNDRLVLNA